MPASPRGRRRRISSGGWSCNCSGICPILSGFKQVLGPWSKGQSVKLDLFERSQDETPYLTGQFIISSIEQTAPAGEDATYSVTFDNDGPVTIDETKLDLNADQN